jgi:hypothetical protein
MCVVVVEVNTWQLQSITRLGIIDDHQLISNAKINWVHVCWCSDERYAYTV